MPPHFLDSSQGLTLRKASSGGRASLITTRGSPAPPSTSLDRCRSPRPYRPRSPPGIIPATAFAQEECSVVQHRLTRSQSSASFSPPTAVSHPQRLLAQLEQSAADLHGLRSAGGSLFLPTANYTACWFLKSRMSHTRRYSSPYRVSGLRYSAPHLAHF